jgi:hypothetical protein
VVDADGKFGGASCDEFEGFGAVDCGVGIGPRDDGGDTACGSGEGGGAEGFLVPIAGFTDFDADINDAGGEAEAVAVDYGGRFWGRRR